MTTQTLPRSLNPAREVHVGPDDRLPLSKTFILGVQHTLAMFVGTISPALLLGRIIGLPQADISYLVSMALIVSGIGTFIQIYRLGPFGSGLLSAQGTSFAFFGPLVVMGKLGGLALMLGMSLCLAPIGLFLGPFLPRMKRFFTPVVSGTVVVLIGISLIPVAMQDVVRGFGPDKGATSLVVACLVLGTVIGLCALGTPTTRTLSVLGGLVVGYVASALLGHFPVPQGSAWFVVPIPVKYGLAFQWQFVLPMGFLYVITALETLGDLTATSQLSGLPLEGPDYWKRIRGGVLADSLNSILAALLCSFPNTTYAQNNGIIQITGVASRQVGYVMAGLLVFCGFIPAVGNWVAVMPEPVLGGMTLLLFGYVAAGGLRILYYSQIQQREWLIIAVSLGIGVGMGAHPEVVNCLPDYLQNFLQSSVVAGGMTALLLNALLPKMASDSAPI